MDIGGLTSTYLNYADTLTGTSGKNASSISSLSDKDLSKASDDELMEVCQEFEAYFMEMIMKEMTKTTGLLGEDSSGSNSALVSYFKDSAITDLAKEATRQNSLGLAQTLYEQMKRNYGLDATVVKTPGQEMSSEKATEITEEVLPTEKATEIE